MKKYLIGGIVAIMLPIVLELLIFSNGCFSNVSNDGWAGFFGGYIGGMATLFAVFLTIDHNNKTFQKQRSIEEKKEEETTRLSVMPYIQSSYNYFNEDAELSDNDIICLLDKEMVKYSFNQRDRMILKQNKNNSGYCFLKYKIRNVGAGGAIEIKIFVDGKDYGVKYALPQGESLNLFLWKHLDKQTSDSILINVDYWDVILLGHYYVREKIDIVVNNGEMETLTDTLASVGHTRLD